MYFFFFRHLILFRFMPADALWTFCMACNVYLTFFHKFDSDQLRQLEWKYLIFCYGLPLIPAVVYFFVDTADRGPVYGSAIVRSPLHCIWTVAKNTSCGAGLLCPGTSSASLSSMVLCGLLSFSRLRYTSVPGHLFMRNVANFAEQVSWRHWTQKPLLRCINPSRAAFRSLARLHFHLTVHKVVSVPVLLTRIP